MSKDYAIGVFKSLGFNAKTSKEIVGCLDTWFPGGVGSDDVAVAIVEMLNPQRKAYLQLITARMNEEDRQFQLWKCDPRSAGS